ncbi:unnamed protein product [Ranitomeya imitator]|uniref:Uncharacterized protein n=1 Tax=Ranitomeya imitator TaxID=111125 RepID=A0ABN9MMW8_9NEOB|nr:unnamed protein product [Ranitomeya imitator]
MILLKDGIFNRLQRQSKRYRSLANKKFPRASQLLNGVQHNRKPLVSVLFGDLEVSIVFIHYQLNNDVCQ